MAGFLAAVAGGALQGLGTGIVNEARQLREERLKDLDHMRGLEKEARDREFTRSERTAAQDYASSEAEKARRFQLDSRQGDLIDMGGGKYGVRNGTKVSPLVDDAGNPVAVSVPAGYRQLTPAEVKAQGLNPSKAYQVSLSGDDRGKISEIGGGGVSVNLGGGDNKQIFDAMEASAVSARSAATGLSSLREAAKALDAGIISGPGADTRLALQKIGAWMGVADPEVIENTETFRAAIAPQVAAMMKATVGSTQISNADREFAEKAAGGSIALDANSIKRLVRIMEKGSRAAIQQHRDRMDKVYPASGGFDRERALFDVQMPPALSETALPPGITEDDITYTMQKHGLTREQVLERLRDAP